MAASGGLASVSSCAPWSGPGGVSPSPPPTVVTVVTRPGGGRLAPEGLWHQPLRERNEKGLCPQRRSQASGCTGTTAAIPWDADSGQAAKVLSLRPRGGTRASAPTGSR